MQISLRIIAVKSMLVRFDSLRPGQQFSVLSGRVFRGTSTKHGLMCLVHGHSAVTPATHQSQIKHSTAKPLSSLSQIWKHWEHSGSVVECLTRDWWVAGLSLTSVTALCTWARPINPCLVLVRHRKTRPDIAEKYWLGGKQNKNLHAVNAPMSLYK